ncbi:hypothetical protein Pelo_16862 [Pelomyxa schiedti]|nr:hypothetical protein Pelo_16862 [Pelomyxa schiedti]
MQAVRLYFLTHFGYEHHRPLVGFWPFPRSRLCMKFVLISMLDLIRPECCVMKIMLGDLQGIEAQCGFEFENAMAARVELLLITGLCESCLIAQKFLQVRVMRIDADVSCASESALYACLEPSGKSRIVAVLRLTSYRTRDSCGTEIGLIAFPGLK